MRPGLHEPVSVLAGYSKKYKVFKPLTVRWGNIDYSLGKVDFYHKTKEGTKVLHHFALSAKDGAAYFKLTLDGASLNWTLEEYQMAGEPEVAYALGL